MESSKFRAWARQLWLDNCDEKDLAGEHWLNEREYFLKFRWWLRREFRQLQQAEQRKQIKEEQIQKSIWVHKIS